MNRVIDERLAKAVWTALLVGLATGGGPPAAYATGKRQPGRLTGPDPGTHGHALDRLLRHPSLAPGRPHLMSPRACGRFVRRVLSNYSARGARPSRDRAMREEVLGAWEQLRPIVAQHHGVDIPPNLHLIAGGNAMLEARAFPDGSILAHRNDVAYARSIASAVAAAGLDDRPALLGNLATVALSAKKGRFSITFGPVDRALYRSILQGALVGLLGHELAHHAGDHPSLDYPNDTRVVCRATDLRRRMRRYFPAGTRRAISLEGLVQGRQLLFAQALEADADRAAVDLAALACVNVDGLMADLVVGAMIDGLRPQPVGSHPPGLYRFDDARVRLKRWDLSSFADGVTRRDLARAMRQARSPCRSSADSGV